MTQPPQAGWFDDPDDPKAQRYWDGQDWTPHRQRKPLSQATQPPPAPAHTYAAAPTNAAPPPPGGYPPPPSSAGYTPPVTPARPQLAATSPFSKYRIELSLAGLALVVGIAALVAGRILLGTFLPGILLIAVIAIIGAASTLRSSQTGQRKAITVAATVLVVAIAIPASTQAVYPVYHYFFDQKSTQTSPPAQASPSTPASRSAPPESASHSSSPDSPSSPATTDSPETGPDTAKVTIDGQEQTVRGTLTCTMGYRNRSGSDHTQVFAGHIGMKNADGVDSFYVAMDAQTGGEQIAVNRLVFGPRDGPGLAYDPNDEGHIQVTRDGNNYQIAGTFYSVTRGSHSVEIDATCPS